MDLKYIVLERKIDTPNGGLINYYAGPIFIRMNPYKSRIEVDFRKKIWKELYYQDMIECICEAYDVDPDIIIEEGDILHISYIGNVGRLVRYLTNEIIFNEIKQHPN